jgi:hypothetical protein
MIKKLLTAFSIVWLLVSCVEPFEIRTDNSSPVIVIYGCLTDEMAYHRIQVSTSSPYFDTQLNRGISGAEVRITSSDDQVFVFEEVDTVPGLYLTTTKMAGIPGETYLLSVETDFDNDGVKEIYTATSTMLSTVAVDSIELKNIQLMGYRFYFLNLYAQDPPTEDYYLCRYKVNDSLIMSRINQLSSMDDRAFNGQYINGMSVQQFWDISERDRIESADDDDDDGTRRIYLSPGDVVNFSLSRIEKGYYNFITQCRKEMRGENPFFGGPPSNIDTNISNGGIGYFATYAFSTVETVVPENNHNTR